MEPWNSPSNQQLLPSRSGPGNHIYGLKVSNSIILETYVVATITTNNELKYICQDEINLS